MSQVGGSKVSSKITVIESLMNVCDKVILGGGMIFTFFKADGMNVGASLVEDDKIELAKDLVASAKKKGIELILPVDVIAADKFAPDAQTKICSSSEIPEVLTFIPPLNQLTCAYSYLSSAHICSFVTESCSHMHFCG